MPYYEFASNTIMGLSAYYQSYMQIYQSR